MQFRWFDRALLSEVEGLTTSFRGIGTDELLAGFGYVNGAWTPAIYQQDVLMSVTGISAHDGSPVWSADYTAFGDRLIGQTGTSANRLQYTGREMDSTGLYYYRARYYDPSIGRFLSEDPLGFAAGINFYAYVGNNPVNANDPSGKCGPLTPLCVAAVEALADTAAAGAVRAGLSTAVNWGRMAWTAAQAPLASGTIGGASGALGSLSTGGDAQDVAINGGVGFVTGLVNPAFQVTGFLANFGKGALLSGAGDFASQAIGLGMSNKSISQNINPLEIGGAAFGGGIASGLTASFGPSLAEQASAGAIGFAPSVAGTAVGQALGTPSPANLQGGFGGPPDMNSFASGAAGGFLLYPNKPNTNQIRSVYAK